MSVATFSQDSLKVFTTEDNYSSVVSFCLSSNNQTHGRITWSGDGKWLTVAPIERGVGPHPIFNYSGQHLQPLKYITLSNISSACFFNWTNRNIAVGNEAGEIFIWDIKEKKTAVKVENVEPHPVDFVAVNSDDTYIASASLSSNKICLHGLKTNKVVNTISILNSNHTSSLKFCMSKKNFLGASSMESTVCVWDIHKSEFVFKSLNSHSGACTDISFSPINYEVIASVSLTKTLRMYDLRMGKLILDANIGEPMNCADIILNGDKVAIGTTSGSAVIYDLRADKVLCTFNAHKSPVLSIKMQNLKIPKTYLEVEMNTPDVIENPSKTLDISVMDIFSPISTNTGKSALQADVPQNKTFSLHSTPKVAANSEFVINEDSFFKKVLSPLPQPGITIHTPQSSPYLCPISEKPEPVEPTYLCSAKQIKDEPDSQLAALNACGDGFQVDNLRERNLYYSDIISEIKNSQKEVLNEISAIKKEVTLIKVDFDKKLLVLQENYERLYNVLLGDIKQEVYAGNCDSKIEHISQRILLNDLSETVMSNVDEVNKQIMLNALRLKRIYEILSGVK